MDISFSDEEVAFRDQVRDFFKQAPVAEVTALIAQPDTYKEGTVRWQKHLFAQGWIAPTWPIEHGGAGWTPTQMHIFETERVAASAPDVLPFGLKMVGPVIYTYGTEQQKQRFLPRILASDDWWCQGYSEPGAGSDLASLKTRAELDGDHYVVNGSKTWTTGAHHADWIFCLVRTSTEGRPQQGISFLLIDMTSPGVTVRPIPTINGEHSLNEVFFDNVRVPVENRIGDENKGWTYAKSLLAHERTVIARVADSKRRLEKLRQYALKETEGGQVMAQDPVFRSRFSDIEAELMALEYTGLRVLAAQASGQGPGAESSLLKIKGTEVQQAIHELTIDLAGPYGGIINDSLTSGDIGHEFGDQARKDYMYGRATTIYGGSNEIQKNITAKHVLGL
ncbi:acyl-CoA dehydrogenase family protein [Marinobacter sediminicola]|uniref:acyl-CoA dehydrogenase family protein n=1 Tax=Marinobacter sediminicola TaxID=3072994 RepID=UPI002810D21D|nr:acyl-CoA dehydrogenase family protein [Marinobacter sp. F26243]